MVEKAMLSTSAMWSRHTPFHQAMLSYPALSLYDEVVSVMSPCDVRNDRDEVHERGVLREHVQGPFGSHMKDDEECRNAVTD